MPIHVYLAVSTELSPDEAYYRVAGRFGPIPDHPPVTPWLAGLIGNLGWLPLELRVRWPSVVLSAALAAGLAWLAKHEAQRGQGSDDEVERAARTAALLATWLPLPAAGGFIFTPDIAASVGWLAALAWGSGALGRRWWAEALTVGLLAFGSLAKVSVLPAALLGAAAALAHRDEGAGQASSGSRGVGAARAAATLLFYSLFLVVTARHLMPSMRFQWAHAFGVWPGAIPGPIAPATSPIGDCGAVLGALGAAVASLGSLALLFSPPVVWLGVITLPRLGAVYRLTALAFTALVLASAARRGVPAEPNWWLPAVLPLLIGAAVAIGKRPPRGVARAGLGAAIVLPTVLALAHAVHPFLPIASRVDPTARLHGWRAGAAPADAPGIGRYGVAAERCAYHGLCEEISFYFEEIRSTLQK